VIQFPPFFVVGSGIGKNPETGSGSETLFLSYLYCIFTVLTYTSIGLSGKAIPVLITVQQKDIYNSLLYSI
jgi:hypothetical protein